MIAARRKLINIMDQTAKPEGEPLFECNLTELLGIRKFLEMSMADLREQVEKASRDAALTTKQFNSIKTHALILTTWMGSALQMTGNMLSTAKAAAPTEIQKQ